MPGRCEPIALTLLLLVSLAAVVVSQNNCGTNSNPYCAGDSKFNALCCPYPSRCFYANRYGAVGCCPPGQDCQNAVPQQVTSASLFSPVPVPVATTAVQTVTTNSAAPTVVGAIGTVTSAVGGAAQTVTSAAGEAFSTVSGILVGNAGRDELSTVLMGVACLSTLVWLGG